MSLISKIRKLLNGHKPSARIVALEDLEVSKPLTAEEISARYASGQFAEMSLECAGMEPDSSETLLAREAIRIAGLTDAELLVEMRRLEKQSADALDGVGEGRVADAAGAGSRPKDASGGSARGFQKDLARMQNPLWTAVSRRLEKLVPETEGFGKFRARNKPDDFGEC